LEYIVIDGASVDHTCEIIRKYEQEISYWTSEPDAGIYDAMNKGIAVSTGDVITFLNSDDWYAENTLNCVERYFQENNADMISGGICFVKNGKAHMVESAKRENIDDYFFDIGFPHPSLFVKAELFKRFGLFNVQYKIAADYEWMLRVCLAGAAVLTVKECFTYFSYGGVSTLRRYDARMEQYRAALQCMEHYGKDYLRERLEKYYTRELENIRNDRDVGEMSERNVEILKNLRQTTGKDFYIWGVGARGKLCMDMFTLAGFNILAFIDSYADIPEYEGYQVLRPDCLEKDICVCVTPEQYEKEILIQLEQKGIDKKHILLFSNILNSFM